MPKASEIEDIKKLRLMLYSVAGGGKTTFFRSLPGKKFLFMFDPAGLCAIQKIDDIEFETFIPENQNIAISTNKGSTNSPVSYSGSDMYLQYEKFINEKIEEDFFSQFSWVGFDSITSLQNLEFDQVANIYGREGRIPQLEDHNTVGDALLKNIRLWSSLPCNICIMAHEKANQDKLMRTIGMDIMVPGQFSKKLCLLLSDIYHLRAVREGKEVVYYADIAPTEEYSLARCSLELDPTVNVTIPRNVGDVTEYGFGRILRDKGYYNESKKE